MNTAHTNDSVNDRWIIYLCKCHMKLYIYIVVNCNPSYPNNMKLQLKTVSKQNLVLQK